MKNGFGKLFNSQQKEIYVGEWENDLFHGQGYLVNSEYNSLNSVYDYKNFEMGVDLYWQSYNGGFKGGMKDGFGTLLLTNGEIFVG